MYLIDSKRSGYRGEGEGVPFIPKQAAFWNYPRTKRPGQAIDQAIDQPHRNRFAVAEGSLAVRHPNVLDLRGVLEVPTAFGLGWIEPVDGAAFVGEDLL